MRSIARPRAWRRNAVDAPVERIVRRELRILNCLRTPGSGLPSSAFSVDDTRTCSIPIGDGETRSNEFLLAAPPGSTRSVRRR